jgi:hypothetical protein
MSFLPWRTNVAVCAPAFIKARIIRQSCSTMVNSVTGFSAKSASLALCIKSEDVVERAEKAATLALVY